MALSTVVTTFDLADYFGTDFDARRVKAWATNNAPDETIHDESTGETRIGAAYATVATDGTGSFSHWAPGVDANPATWQTTYHFDVPDRTASRGRRTLTLGPFTVTTSSELTALVEEQIATPTATASDYATAAGSSADDAALSATNAATSEANAQTAETNAELAQALAEAARDDAVDISGISTSDAVVEALVKNTGGAGPLTSAALSATYVGRWQADRNYTAGDITSTGDGALIERLTTGTSAPTYAADASNWKTASGLVEDIASRMGVNLKDYPRTGGETDDMPRVRRALTAVAARTNSRRLLISEDLTFAFVAGSTITNPTRVLVTDDNIEIMGFGRPQVAMTGLTTAYLFSIDDYASSGRDIFTAFSFAGVDNCHISGFRFVGTWTSDDIFRYQSPRAIGVAFKGATNSSARNLYGEDIHGNVVNVVNSYIDYDAPFANSENVTVENVHAVHCLENGVNFMGGTKDCIAGAITATGCANGMESACDGFTVNGAILTGNRSSNLALSGTKTIVNGAILTGAVRNESGVPNPGYGFGVVITGGSDIQFNGGKFNDNYSHGIYIYPGVTDVTFNNPEVKRNAKDATNKVAIQIVGTAGSRIQRITINGGELLCEGAVTGSIPNYADDVRISGMAGTFDTAASALAFASDCNGSRAVGNRFNKPVTMNDPTGEAFDNGTYRRFDRSSVPTTGSWLLGDMVFNTAPGQGAIAQWRCIQGGTFGTLNSSATTGSITSGTTALTVNSATGLYRGAWITIAGVTGAKKVTAVSGTTVTIDSAADATVAGAAIAYRTAVFAAASQNGPKTSVAAAPDFVGQHALTANVPYVATGTSAATDWKRVPIMLTATAALDFPSVAAGGSQELTITVTGAAVGDDVRLGPPAAPEAGLVWNGYVSAANTVKVRVTNVTAASIDPASATWRASVTK